jgi:glycosyltransferase involved in cell wall biosynthesis
MSGGVVTLIESMSRRQLDEGAEIEVMFTRRLETPTPEDLRRRFSADVRLVELDGDGTRRAAFALLRAVRVAQRSRRFDTIHLHSSIAGAVGRLASLTTRHTASVFYSPHGFAFLREDQSRAVNAVTKLAERALANVGGLIVTSNSEVVIAKRSLRARNVDFVRTGMRRDSIDALPSRERHSPVTVAMVGRVSYQKAPWRFAEVARRLGEVARFVWIGDGPDDLKRQWLGDAPVEVLGWLSPADLDQTMATIDVLLFPTLWEGFALSLAQAQASGIPAVVSDVVGNRDAVVEGVTGFVCTSDDELTERVRLLVAEPQIWHQMSLEAVSWAKDHLVDDFLGKESLELYEAAATKK